MNLYIQQSVFTWGDRFAVYDSAGNPVYYVQGEVFTLGKRLHLYDLSGRELAYIEQRIFTFLPKYTITRPGFGTVEVIKEFTFINGEYSIPAMGWKVYGDFWNHNYEVTDGQRRIASVSKEWFTFGDAYQISLPLDTDEVLALSVVLVIDACIESN